MLQRWRAVNRPETSEEGLRDEIGRVAPLTGSEKTSESDELEAQLVPVGPIAIKAARDRVKALGKLFLFIFIVISAIIGTDIVDPLSNATFSRSGVFNTELLIFILVRATFIVGCGLALLAGERLSRRFVNIAFNFLILFFALFLTVLVDTASVENLDLRRDNFAMMFLLQLCFPCMLVNLMHYSGELFKTQDRGLCYAVIALEGDGQWGLFAEYSQWEQQRAERRSPAAPKKAPVETVAATPVAKKKLSYMEQREWDAMEQQIMEAEEELAASKSALDDPAVFSDHTRVQDATVRMDTAQHGVDALYARWAELEAKVG